MTDTALKGGAFTRRDGEGPVFLRPLGPADLPLTLAWRNHFRHCFKNSHEIEPDAHRAWYRAYQAKADDLVFAVVERDGGRLVGQVSVYDIDAPAAQAEVGRFLVDPALARRGYTTAAGRLLLAFCFGDLGLRRLYIDVFATNQPSIGLFRSLGFVQTRHEGALLSMECLRKADPQ